LPDWSNNCDYCLYRQSANSVEATQPAVVKKLAKAKTKTVRPKQAAALFDF
jgi:hypothetical protein